MGEKIEEILVGEGVDFVEVEDESVMYDKYFANPTFWDDRIIAYGTDPIAVHDLAKKKGFEEPVIDYMRDPSKKYLDPRKFNK